MSLLIISCRIRTIITLLRQRVSLFDFLSLILGLVWSILHVTLILASLEYFGSLVVEEALELAALNGLGLLVGGIFAVGVFLLGDSDHEIFEILIPEGTVGFQFGFVLIDAVKDPVVLLFFQQPQVFTARDGRELVRADHGRRIKYYHFP